MLPQCFKIICLYTLDKNVIAIFEQYFCAAVPRWEFPSSVKHGVVIFADHNFAFLTETQEGSLKLRGNLHSYVGLGRINVT